MRMSEEELPVEVRKINRIKVDYVNLLEASGDKVLEKLAANAAGSDD